MARFFPLGARGVRHAAWVVLLALLWGCGSSGPGDLPLATGAVPGVDGAGNEVPTVDISGRWQGKWYSNKTPSTGLLANLIISQNGNDFIGNLEVVGAFLIIGTRPVDGSVLGLKVDGEFDSGVATADWFADVDGRNMDGTYQFRFPFPDEFGTFNMVHE